MQLKYEWEPEEWREALLLASAGPRRPPKPLMTYLVVSIMAAGSMGELVNAVRASNQAQYSGSLLPLLLFTAAIAGATHIYSRAASRNRRLRALACMPTGTQSMVLNEGGWRSAAADDATAEQPVRPWTDLREQRTGARSMILLGDGGTFAALPLRALNASQGGLLHRLVTRKLRHVPRLV